MHIIREQGCPKCKGYNMTNDEFIEKSIKIHDNKYKYDDTFYKSKKDTVKIYCNEHGYFEQMPYLHLKGCGCPYCAGCARSNNEEFIIKANKIHNNIYDYSKVNYKNAKSKIEIICKKHGSFWQTPNKHLTGRGCPKCKNSKSENFIKKYLKNNNIKFKQQQKFDGCKYKRNLYFDFYLPEKNICLEYDGEQHFINFRYKKDDKEKLEIRKIRDNIKNIYCKENNIKLYRIKYTDKIEEKLNDILNVRKI